MVGVRVPDPARDNPERGTSRTTRNAVPGPLMARPRRVSRPSRVGMDQRRFSTMRDVHRLEPMSAGPGRGAVLAAWERFVQGEDQVPGVRPEVAISWHRCREQYRVDPHLAAAPVAVAEIDHTPEHDVVFTELGFLRRVGGARRGRRRRCRHRHRRHRPDPGRVGRPGHASRRPPRPTSRPGSAGRRPRRARTAWARRSRRTARSLVRGAEHWCQAFHNWVCAGIAVRDVVSREPIAVLNISCWRSQVPATAGSWLANAVTKTQCLLRTARPRQRRRAARRVHPGQGPVRRRRSPRWTPRARW